MTEFFMIYAAIAGSGFAAWLVFALILGPIFAAADAVSGWSIRDSYLDMMRIITQALAIVTLGWPLLPLFLIYFFFRVVFG